MIETTEYNLEVFGFTLFTPLSPPPPLSHTARMTKLKVNTGAYVKK